MPEMDRSHFDFVVKSLRELSSRLELIGGRLAVRVGVLPDVFIEIAKDHNIAGLHSHEETGNGFTYDRDRRVANWARNAGIPWKQSTQNGVVRPLKSRDGWSKLWKQRMAQPLAPTPTRLCIPTDFEWGGKIPSGDELGLPETTKTKLQIGGSAKAEETLQSFLAIRGASGRVPHLTIAALKRWRNISTSLQRNYRIDSAKRKSRYWKRFRGVFDDSLTFVPPTTLIVKKRRSL